eukprot:NODE_3297_length_2057_cov_7.360622.p1 GENE.NODE_3297_length_2057_cov_7.360622~~NODE_3297_length_2057_cov_7.360622.p1  ORF type:complete len:568 (+),score=192.64 NODE_3297_length_2057_cov_7.360622:73-1704(+)
MTREEWDLELEAVLISAALHYTLRYSPMIRRVAEDLHTAARAGDTARVRKLLVPGSNGQVLDVNAVTKDGADWTPLMFAARAGHVEALCELVGAGADLDSWNVTGETSLHLAARHGHAEACHCLISFGANKDLRNTAGESPEEVAHSRLGNHDMEAVLAALRSETDGSILRAARAARKQVYNVNATLCAAVQLRGLFPDAADDDAPSPRALHSVSGLIISRTAGAVARRVLSRQDESSASPVPLGALRRVRELGKGSFGRVIEVELPTEGNFWRRSTGGRHFALKLQLKAEAHRNAYSEVLALRRAHHPFIVRLERAFQTPRFFALLLELCLTDLNRRLLAEESSDGRCYGLAPNVGARYMGQVLLALVHLHENECIVFRDVKPDNVLISERDEAKLTDFGLAKVMTSFNQANMSMCGTHGFFAPELVEPRCVSRCEEGDTFNMSFGSGSPTPPQFEPHDVFKMDSYSFGVTLQVLSDLCTKGFLSPEGFDLMERLQTYAVPRRCLLRDVISHEFFSKSLGCIDMREHLMSGLEVPTSSKGTF